MPNLFKGEHGALNVSQTAKHRIMCGLGWDPKDRITLTDRLAKLAGKNKTAFDLDLYCLIYDREGRYLDQVSTEKGKETNEEGSIYHSGDDIEGIGAGDDEHISIELKNQPDNIGYFLLTASIKSDHKFGDVPSPHIRLVDGYSNHEFLIEHPGQRDGAEKSLFVFCCIYRSEESEENTNPWRVYNISEYYDLKEKSDWNNYLRQYLIKSPSK